MVQELKRIAPTTPERPRYSVVLPGPDRKRQPGEYAYRLIYRCNDSHVVGCLAAWEVDGGRDQYQVALEQQPGGWRVWHCTCADAVYRAEPQGRVCKHVLGLLAFGPPLVDAA
ncbi:MAG: hypothetical protein ACJ8C4_12745 [Gemmataceae bacterium]|jgi:hypothetical protein